MGKYLKEVKNFLVEKPSPTYGECVSFLLGFGSAAGYSSGRKDLLLLGIDVNALKFARKADLEVKRESKVSALTHVIRLTTDFASKYDKFAIVQGNNVITFGKSFEDLEQSRGEMFAVIRAIEIAAATFANRGMFGQKIEVTTDAKWICSRSGKASVINELERETGHIIQIKWIPGVENPADYYTRIVGYQAVVSPTIEIIEEITEITAA